MGQAFLHGAGSGGAALNFKIVGSTTEPSSPKENTIWVNTDTKIPLWAFGDGNPYVGYEDIDLNENSVLGDGYLSTSNVATPDETNGCVYTENYIPVTYGKTYTWKYTVSSTQSMWLAICEYSGDKVFSSRVSLLSATSGTVQAGTYTPSSASITSVRMTWRAFGDPACVVNLIDKDVPYTLPGTETGTVWVSTGTDSPVEFNALKKNAIQLCPIAACQYDGSQWVSKDALIYQAGEWKSWWDGLLYSYGTFGTPEQDFVLTPSTASHQIRANDIMVQTVESANSEVYIRFGPINLTRISQIDVAFQLYSATTNAATTYGTCFCSQKANASYTEADAIATYTGQVVGTSEIFTQTLDISGLSGDYYVYCGTNTANAVWAKVRGYILKEAVCK